MPSLPDLFPGFSTHNIQTSGAQIYVRVGGSGVPLVLLHGYPQTHVCWHKIAPQLAAHFTVIIPDLRGYGSTSAPEGDPPEHARYSKRAMACDVVELMATLGHKKFMVAGHDRGGRVAYRMALDHGDQITKLAVLDILPTSVVWRNADAPGMISAYHWPFLAQPAPLPETLIAADPAYYVSHTLASWTRSHDLSPFSDDALTHYRAALTQPERIHAICEDYRAGATIDRVMDEADERAGNKISCPTLALWGTHYVGKGDVDVLSIWRAWCVDVTGREIESGHFLLEENPSDTLAAMLEFFLASQINTAG